MITYNRIPFTETPLFKDLFEMAKEFYIQIDYSVKGNYIIIPELKGNGKINRINLNPIHLWTPSQLP